VVKSDIRIRFLAYPIRFHLSFWLKGYFWHGISEEHTWNEKAERSSAEAGAF
jgi:hypothetical protein